MAVKYSMSEAFEVLVANNDQEALDDIFRRYGGPARKMLRAICSSRDLDALRDIINLVPEYVTMQKVNKIHRELEEDEDYNPEADVPIEVVKNPKQAKKAAKPAPEPEPVEEDNEDEVEETGKYDGKNARELYELCKKRGIETQPRKRATTYKKLLEEDDAKQADEPDVVEEDDDDEDWDI